MKTTYLFTLSALLIAQAHAAPTPGAFSGPLTATPSGQSNGREIYFKLPLTGDTKNCVINISYGDKPGALPNNDGDTHLNGGASLDRVRTYGADGTYTFTAKAKSGCTGEAKVTFTIGNSARSGGATAPGTLLPAAPAVINAHPGMTIAHTKIVKVEAPTLVKPGTPLVVKVFGTGVESTCPTTVLIGKDSNAYFKKGPVQWATGAWPRVASFLLEPGLYTVRISMTEGGPGSTQAEREACGTTYANGNTGVPGDGTVVRVGDDIAK
ncbi:MAG: hypothetical protein JWQ72_3009 [Polaromonas sp.]|nr:hypothetical protein [Polaromonas sp.]